MIDRINRSAEIFLIIIVNQLDRYLGVRLRIEPVTVANQLLFQFLVILDDPVVNADDVAIVAAVGVRVVLRRLAVRRPAGVADSARSCDRSSIIRLFFQMIKTPLRLDDLRIL